MPDDPDMLEESTDLEPEAGTSADQTTTPPPWGDDFDAQRAWDTIQKQRAREEELEKDAKAYQRLQSDDDAFREFLEAKGLTLDDGSDDDEDDEFAEEPDPVLSEINELKAWREQQEQERAEARKRADLDAFNAHLEELAEGSGVELTARERKLLLQESLEAAGTRDKWVTGEATEAAFKEHLAWREGISKGAVKKLVAGKKAPHVPSGGQAATHVPSLDNDQERIDHMVRKLQANT